jgi:hypothetical protein
VGVKCYANMGQNISNYVVVSMSFYIMSTLKRHALHNHPFYYACIGSSFKSVLICVCVPVCSILEQYQSSLQASLLNRAHSLLVVVVIDPSKGNELCNNNLHVLQ